MSTSPNFVSTVNNFVANYNISDLLLFGTDLDYSSPRWKCVYKPGTSGSWVRAMNVFSAAHRTLIVEVGVRGGTGFVSGDGAQSSDPIVLCRVPVPPMQSTNILDPSMIPAMDPSPNRGLRLQPGSDLYIRPIGSVEAYYKDYSTDVTNILNFTGQSALVTQGTNSSLVSSYSLLKRTDGSVYGFEVKLNNTGPAANGYFVLNDPERTVDEADTPYYVLTRDGRFLLNDTELVHSHIPAPTGSTTKQVFLERKKLSGSSHTITHISGYTVNTATGLTGINSTNIGSLVIDADGSYNVGGSSLGTIGVAEVARALPPFDAFRVGQAKRGTYTDSVPYTSSQLSGDEQPECINGTPLLFNEELEVVVFGGDF